jgi:hypothetical protein
LGLVVVLACAGCVRRTARFTSEPEGARVWLNDRDIGRTPASVDFTWYGDYDVVYRLEGHRTVKTHVRLDPPLYQRFPLDFFAEVLWPGQIHDHHEAATVLLEAAQPADEAELIERARQLRQQAQFPQQ